MPIPIDAAPPAAVSALAPQARVRVRIDLLGLIPAPSCAVAGSGEIVVCARRTPDPDRLAPLPEFARTGLPKAEFKLLGQSRIAAEVDRRDFGRDFSNRALVTLKIPF